MEVILKKYEHTKTEKSIRGNVGQKVPCYFIDRGGHKVPFSFANMDMSVKNEIGPDVHETFCLAP